MNKKRTFRANAGLVLRSGIRPRRLVDASSRGGSAFCTTFPEIKCDENDADNGFVWSTGRVDHPASASTAQQKTAKQCNDEWKADKIAIQASGKTKKVFVAECRGFAVGAAKPIGEAEPAGQGQHATESDAKATCPTDNVVWVNLNSYIYHASSSKSYGKTKRGAYMCEKESVAAGFRAPKLATRS